MLIENFKFTGVRCLEGVCFQGCKEIDFISTWLQSVVELLSPMVFQPSLILSCILEVTPIRGSWAREFRVGLWNWRSLICDNEAWKGVLYFAVLVIKRWALSKWNEFMVSRKRNCKTLPVCLMQMDYLLPFKYAQFLLENAVIIALGHWMGKLEYDAHPEWAPHKQNGKVGMVEGEIPVIQLNRGKDYSLPLVICTISTEEIAQILEVCPFYYAPELLDLTGDGKIRHLLSIAGICLCLSRAAFLLK